MYKIDIDNKQEVLLRLTLDNEDDEIKMEFNWKTYRESLAEEEYISN